MSFNKQRSISAARARGARAVILAAVFAGAAATSWADVRECLVVGVSDGDTITMRCGTLGSYQQVKVRLSGIDAPEKRQPFGTRARVALGEMVFGRWALLDCPKADRNGRKLCSVWVAPASAPPGPQTLDAGLAMVTLGLAWWYRAYAREQTLEARMQYEVAEDEARVKRVGLWQDAGPVAPWEWRQQGRPRWHKSYVAKLTHCALHKSSRRSFGQNRTR